MKYWYMIFNLKTKAYIKRLLQQRYAAPYPVLATNLLFGSEMTEKNIRDHVGTLHLK